MSACERSRLLRHAPLGRFDEGDQIRDVRIVGERLVLANRRHGLRRVEPGREQKAERAVERANARLPSLPGPSVSARIRTAEQERDRLKTRVEALEQQLKEKEQELERIRKTIRP